MVKLNCQRDINEVAKNENDELRIYMTEGNEFMQKSIH